MLASSSQHGTEGLNSGQAHAVLLCRVGLLVCALPLAHVSETMRPLACEPLAGTAPFVNGISIIRGGPVPVVDLARLLGVESDETRTRLVLVRVGTRTVALAVDRVIGVRALDASSLTELPPLLAGASAAAIAAVGSLDARLLLLLEASKALPELAGLSPDSGARA